ncbi:Hypothetical protein A7982_01413 [Minicystis rosea]|nr:Hypothetical protein A7982_01413 [Minicystis rosea]
MDAPWQLAWIRGRLAPRWIVEAAARQRAKRVRLSFVAARPIEVESIALSIAEKLGSSWRVDVDAIRVGDCLLSAAQPFDLVWALGALSALALEERQRFASAVEAALAPGGCFIVDPSETAARSTALSPCGAPGVLLKCAWPEPIR